MTFKEAKKLFEKEHYCNFKKLKGNNYNLIFDYPNNLIKYNHIIENVNKNEIVNIMEGIVRFYETNPTLD